VQAYVLSKAQRARLARKRGTFKLTLKTTVPGKSRTATHAFTVVR
jgi:hypothetical protein